MATSSNIALPDPFAWREALTPVGGVSPASTARSNRSTPRYDATHNSGVATPTSNTPPSSPTPPLEMSARSVGSNTSSRSGRHAGLPPSGMYDQARSVSSGSVAAPNSYYETPNSSARISEFGSVYEGSYGSARTMYDSTSHCGSARTADLSSVYENQNVPNEANKKASRKKQNAYAAAFDSFAPIARTDNSSPINSHQLEAADVSLDPRQVFSSARHGRHKEVEASLAAGFDPYYADQFGNTLFHVACQNGNKRIAKLAIKYGGDMDARNLKGNTGVHFLFSYGYADIGEYFIEKGASDRILNELGNDARSGIR